MSVNDLDLYDHDFFKTSFRWLHKLTLTSQAITDQTNPLFAFFPIQKPKWPNLMLPQNRSRSIKGHHLNKLERGLQQQCCIPSFKGTGHLVPEKNIFEGFLPYVGVVAILVMWPRPYEQTFVPFVPQPHGGSTCNLISISLAVSEEMSFENVDEADTDANDEPLPIL